MKTLNQVYQLLDVRMQIFPARTGSAASCLKVWSFKLDLQRVHKTIHQPPKGSDCCKFYDFGTIEVPGKQGEGFIVVASFVPRYQFGPPDNGFLTLTEKLTRSDIHCCFNLRGPDHEKNYCSLLSGIFSGGLRRHGKCAGG